MPHLTKNQLSILDLLEQQSLQIEEIIEIIPSARNEISGLINKSIIAQTPTKQVFYYLTTPGKAWLDFNRSILTESH